MTHTSQQHPLPHESPLDSWHGEGTKHVLKVTATLPTGTTVTAVVTQFPTGDASVRITGQGFNFGTVIPLKHRDIFDKLHLAPTGRLSYDKDLVAILMIADDVINWAIRNRNDPPGISPLD